MIELVPATPEIMRRAIGQPPPYSSRAIAAVRGDEVLGCAGVYRQASHLVMFAELTDELRRNPKWIVRGYRWLMKIAAARRIPVIAAADDHEASERFLEHLGFTRLEGRIFQWLP